MTPPGYRGRRLALAVGLCATLAASAPAAAREAAPFQFARDTFAFANDTVWEYDVDGATGRTAWRRREPASAFALRCANMVRAARQFHLHARFVPDRPVPDAATLAAIVGRVLARDPRVLAPAPDPIEVPGYAGLRALSAAHEALLKDALGGMWRSYRQRGNWRMIFPFPPGQQRAQADELVAALARGATPILHVLRFPELSLNHLVLLFGVTQTPDELVFDAYDPNDAGAPIVLRWDRGARTFVYPRTIYFGGGPVKAYAVYDGLLS